MKKMLSILLILAIFLATIPFAAIPVSAATSGTTGDCTWTLDDTVLTIYGNGKMGDFTSGSNLPWGNSVTEIVVKPGVTSVGKYAFYHCKSLISIKISESVTSIGSYAFADCSSITSITIPESVKSIGDCAFSKNSSLEVVNFNAINCVKMGSYSYYNEYTVFYNCSNLKTVNIGENVISIPDCAFMYCHSLPSIIIPDSVTSIGNFAFRDCYTLSSVIIGESVESIGSNAFDYCSSLTSLTIPDSITSIGDDAFRNCYALLSVVLGDSVTNIGDYAFYNCSSLTSITLSGSLMSIGNHAFNGCKSLENVFYRKSESDVSRISIGAGSNYLTYATWYYNSCIKSSKHSYSLNCNNTCEVCKDSKAPNIPTVAKISSDFVVLNKVEGFEYSIDGINWQENNVFENLKPITKYVFYQRVKESNIAKVSEKSEGLSVTTLKQTNSVAIFAPTVDCRTDKSVALTNVDGCEYSIDGTTWQSSNVFTNLLPNTEYTFYQRFAETNNTYASETSEGLTVKTYIENTNIPNKPTVLVFDDTSVTLKKVNGIEYSLDGENWQESNIFNELLPNTIYSFYQRYAQDGDVYHSTIGPVLYITTDRSIQKEIPTAPIAEITEAYKVVLIKIDGCEYSKDGINWQSSNVFTGLSPVTEYTFYQRYAQNATYYAGKTSDALTVTTLKGVAKTPNAPSLQSKGFNKVILTYVEGYEYSMDGENWQKSNIFTGLKSFTNYAFFCRVAETDKNHASESSDALIVKTLEMPEFIIGDCNGDGEVNTTDLAVMKLFLAGVGELSDTGKLGADLNGDGEVNTTDLASLKLKLAGI